MRKILTGRVISFGLSLITFLFPFAAIHLGYGNEPLAIATGVDLMVGVSIPDLKINSFAMTIAFLSGCAGLISQFLAYTEAKKRKIAWRSALFSVIFLCFAFFTFPLWYITNFVGIRLLIGYYTSLVLFVISLLVSLKRNLAPVVIKDVE